MIIQQQASWLYSDGELIIICMGSRCNDFFEPLTSSSNVKMPPFWEHLTLQTPPSPNITCLLALSCGGHNAPLAHAERCLPCFSQCKNVQRCLGHILVFQECRNFFYFKFSALQLTECTHSHAKQLKGVSWWRWENLPPRQCWDLPPVRGDSSVGVLWEPARCCQTLILPPAFQGGAGCNL